MKWILLLFLGIHCFAQEKIFFLHIPKSGGITFRSLLEEQYHCNEAAFFIDANAFNDESIDPECRLLAGHILYSKVKNLVQDFKKVTLLRNPIERVLSEHYYICNRVDPSKTNIRKKHLLPSEGDPIETASNVACQFLSQLDPTDPSILMQQHLESAKRTLSEECIFVGISEEMQTSIQLFFQSQGWEVPAEIPTHNTTKRDQTDYPPALLEGIARRNWADIALYDYAKELFKKTKEGVPSILIQQPSSLVNQIDYDFLSPLDGSGWCPRERFYDGKFRWLSSTENGSIKFPLLHDQGYTVQLEIFIPRDLLAYLSFSVDGIFLPHSMKHLEGNGEYQWFQVLFQIPASFIERDKKTQIRIALQDPHWIVPLDSYRGRCGCRRITISQCN